MCNIAVAPLVGAWIEIPEKKEKKLLRGSLLSWERGLKFLCNFSVGCAFSVAPLVGAWIEIQLGDKIPQPVGRSSRGSVD